MSREYLRFDPAIVPTNAEELPTYLSNTLLEIRAALEVVRNGHLDVVYAEPAKPYQGIYFYNAAGTWTKL